MAPILFGAVCGCSLIRAVDAIDLVFLAFTKLGGESAKHLAAIAQWHALGIGGKVKKKAQARRKKARELRNSTSYRSFD